MNGGEAGEGGTFERTDVSPKEPLLVNPASLLPWRNLLNFPALKGNVPAHQTPRHLVLARTFSLPPVPDAGTLQRPPNRSPSLWPIHTASHSSSLKQGDWDVSRGPPTGQAGQAERVLISLGPSPNF